MMGPILIVMRLADMEMVHPDQVVMRCARCQHEVGVYPSGQKIISEYPGGGVEVVCSVCRSPGPHSKLAPGALDETSQSRRRGE